MIEFYMSAVGVFLTITASLIAAWLGWRISKGMSARPAYRIMITSFATLAVVSAMTWDVVRTSITMAQLCPQAGVHVKKTVKVDGFYTNAASPDMLGRGVKFIESHSHGNRIVVYVRSDDAVVKEEFDTQQYLLKSRYEYIYDSVTGPIQGRRDIGIQKSVVRDRKTGEELGYAIRFKAYPGWIDRNTFSRISQVLWMCHSHIDQEIQLRKQVLLSN